MADVNPRLVMVACVCSALVAAFTIDLYAAVPDMTTGRYGEVLSRAPLWTALTGFGWALGQFFSGKLLEFGVRRGIGLAIALAMGMSALSLFMPSYEVALGMRVISGFFAGLTFAAVRIFLRQVCVDEGLGQVMSTFSVAFLAGIMIAPVVGVYALKFIGFWGVLGAHALMCGIAIPTLWFLPARIQLASAPPSQDPRGLELPTWAAQSLQGSASFVAGISLAFLPVVLIEHWDSADWLPVFTVSSLFLGIILAKINHRLLSRFRLLHLMTVFLFAAGAVFLGSLVFWFQQGIVVAFGLMMVFGIPIFTTAASNAEAITMSREAKSYSHLARRRALPVTLGNIGFISVSYGSQFVGVSTIGIWPHVGVAIILMGLIGYFLLTRQRRDRALAFGVTG